MLKKHNPHAQKGAGAFLACLFHTGQAAHLSEWATLCAMHVNALKSHTKKCEWEKNVSGNVRSHYAKCEWGLRGIHIITSSLQQSEVLTPALLNMCFYLCLSDAQSLPHIFQKLNKTFFTSPGLTSFSLTPS